MADGETIRAKLPEDLKKRIEMEEETLKTLGVGNFLDLAQELTPEEGKIWTLEELEADSKRSEF